MANLATLRAAVFSLSAKNRTGGLKSTPPPPVRGLRFLTFVRLRLSLRTSVTTGAGMPVWRCGGGREEGAV